MEFIFIIPAFGLLWSVPHVETIDWCATLLRCHEKKNTLCAYGKEDVDAFKCSDQKDLVQTNKDIKSYWLALHNTFRDQIAAGYVPGLPSAANMIQLEYADELSLQARRWAFQCKFEDDPCCRSPLYNNQEPETVYNETRLLGNLLNDTRAAVLARFLENINGYNSFPSNLIDKFSATSFDTNQQVDFVFHAFAEIRDIGASLVLYNWSEGGTLHPFLKSNTYYGPPIDKGPLYQRGHPCSRCPDDFRCNRKSTYRNLCARKNDPASEEYADGLPGAPLQRVNGAINPGIFGRVIILSTSICCQLSFS